jgi:D-psicose/D-tagatose/L-ribulose 3-epimerase
MSGNRSSTLKYAVHAYAWTASWSNKTLDLIDHAKSQGFDLIEIPLMEIDLVDAEAIRRRAETANIGLLTSTACAMDTDPTGEDAATRKRGTEYLLACVRKTAAMGATCFSGVTYSAIGRRLGCMPGSVYWKRAASALKKAARLGQKLGVTVGIEPINRYETFLVNTCEQALQLRKMIDEPNVAVHLDAYHMNIEETDFYGPTCKAARHLCHYHLSESHRGTVGTGTVDWDAIYKALGHMDYRGSVGLESFIEPSPAMAAATCIWRRLAPSADKSLRDGLAYLKDLERKYYRRR